MKPNFTLFKLLFLCFFSSIGISKTMAQKPTWTIPVIVYIDQATANVYGGAAGIEPKIKAQFQQINQYYNMEPRFNGIMNFVPQSFKYFTDNINDDNVADGIEQSPLDAGYMLRVIYDQFPHGYNWNGSYITTKIKGWHNLAQHTIMWGVDPGSYWNSADMFDFVMTKGLVHETGHSRGAYDLYSTRVVPGKNYVIPDASFNSELTYSSFMNGLAAYPNPGWDINSINTINLSNGQLVTEVMNRGYYNGSWPSTINVRVKDQNGNPVSGTNVKLYGVSWLKDTLAATPYNVSEYTSNSQGLVTLSGTDLTLNPFKPHIDWDVVSEYSNIMVVATYNGQSFYNWMPFYEVQNVKIQGGNAYYLDFTMNVTTNTCTIPAWNAGTAYTNGAHVSYNGKEYVAKWWTQNNQPDINTGDGKPWTLVGPCGTQNVNPTATITSPLNTWVVVAGNVTLNADAKDTDGTITKVEFYNGSTLIGTSTTAPYSYTWNNVGSGTYTITAKAYDNAGGTGVSSAVTFTVDTPPVVSITSPTQNQQFNSTPASVTVNATATDADGTIKYVEFYNGPTLLGSDNTSPYSFNWTGLTAGTFSVTAKATDNYNITSYSSVITFNVVNNNLPVVTITSPSTGSKFNVGGSVTVTATVANTQGTITKVEIYSPHITNSTQTFTAAPYTATFSNLASSGQRGLTTFVVKAYNSVGGVGQATIDVLENKVPVVSITSPANNVVVDELSNVVFAAFASDPDGSIAKVEYFRGTTKIGQATASPYSVTWSNVAAGTYAVTAIATDNNGASTSSTAITVNVNKKPVVSTPTVSGAPFTAPAIVGLSVTASDADGSIAKVEFLNGSTVIKTFTTPTSGTYSFSWTGVAAGNYSISVRATDNRGAVTATLPVAVSVTGSGCSAAQWTIGNSSYVAGTIVKNTVSGVVRSYRCEVAGWCQSSSTAYEPGNGWAASTAWTDLGVCSAKMAANYHTAPSGTISVYPNPTEGIINISLKEGTNSNVQVINSLGVEVSNKVISKDEVLDISELPLGIYTLKITSGDQVWLERIVKN